MNSKSIFTVVFKMSPHHILRLLADFSRELCPVCILTKRARAFVGFFLSKDCNLSMLRNRSRLLRRCEPLQLPWCGASSVHSVSAGMRNNPKKNPSAYRRHLLLMLQMQPNSGKVKPRSRKLSVRHMDK